jgi:hypothetical protein
VPAEVNVKRMATVGTLVAMLAIGLGCSGVMTDMDAIPDAGGMGGEHPSDFVFPAPADGELELSTTNEMMGKKTTTVTYLMSKDAAKSAMETYKGVLDDMGLDVNKSETAGIRTLTALDGDKVYTCSASPNGDEMRVTLVSVVPAE